MSSSARAAPVQPRNPGVGWRDVSLGDVVSGIRGVTFARDEATSTPFEGSLACLTTSGVHDPVRWSTRRFIPGARVSVPNQLLKVGDILVSTANSRELVGRSCLVEELPFPCTFGAFVTALRPVPGIEPYLVAAYLRTSTAMQFFQRASSHTTGISNLRVSELLSLRVCLPPAADQGRLATTLKEQLAAVERARAVAEERVRAARQLGSAYLEQEFAGSEAQRWPRMRLGDLLLAPLKTGISRRGSPAAKKRCLTLSSIRDGRLDLSISKPADVSDEEAAGNWVQPAAFYVVRGNGNLSLVGRGGLAPTAVDHPVLYPDLLIQVVLRPELVLGEYLRLAWDTSAVRREIERGARTSAGIQKINQQNLASVLVPVPPLEQQAQVVAVLDRSEGVVSGAEQAATAELAAISDLPAALLRRAFSGAL